MKFGRGGRATTTTKRREKRERGGARRLVAFALWDAIIRKGARVNFPSFDSSGYYCKRVSPWARKRVTKLWTSSGKATEREAGKDSNEGTRRRATT